ncbi:MAG: ATP-binding cassette domain-containing protein [Armatimonadetes bacterium]|nr:ATP-binding cassette domain-containing protein [Armatimonadota bacterium]
MSEPAILSADSVTARHATAQASVLNAVNFSILPGEVAAISGPSGSGKSTLLWCLAKLTALESGEVYLRGQAQRTVSPAMWRRSVVLMPQTTVLVSGTVLDNVLLPHSLQTYRRHGGEVPSPDTVRVELDTLGLERIPLDRSVAELSGGEAQKVAFVRTLLTKPECLLCDEPASNLDHESTQKLLARIRRFADEGHCAVIVRHGQESLEGFRNFRLSEGRLDEIQ